MKGQGGGGTSRGGGKNTAGGGSTKVTKTSKRQTKEIDDNIVCLRAALYAESGRDKDVTAQIAPAFMKYDRNGLNVQIKFSAKLTTDEVDLAFDMAKENMEALYDQSGYGWDDDDKMDELSGQGGRFLIIRSNESETMGDFLGFVHFRFTVKGEIMEKMKGDTCLYMWDIHLNESIQRKGLGRHLFMILELIARRESIKNVSVPIQFCDENMLAYVNSKLKGYVPDSALEELVGFDAEMEGFHVYSKALVSPNKPVPVVAARAATLPQEQEKKSIFAVPSVSSAGAAEVKSATDGDAAESEDESEDVPMNNYDVIHGLKVLFKEKHGRDATEEEVQQWVATLKDTNIAKNNVSANADADCNNENVVNA